MHGRACFDLHDQAPKKLHGEYCRGTGSNSVDVFLAHSMLNLAILAPGLPSLKVLSWKATYSILALGAFARFSSYPLAFQLNKKERSEKSLQPSNFVVRVADKPKNQPLYQPRQQFRNRSRQTAFAPKDLRSPFTTLNPTNFDCTPGNRIYHIFLLRMHHQHILRRMFKPQMIVVTTKMVNHEER
jgi:hypothetical protein